MAKQSIVPNIVSDQAKKLANYSDIGLALGVLGIILVLIFPIPTFLLDLLLAISITSSVVILMTCLFIHKPLELSSFPTILLITAILRLSLNVASTRLILARGHLGPSAAGHVIEAFGSFIMQGSLVIGIIVFMILTIINFIVITKGSGRIAEVAARFSLDAMPGKQMAIDADLAAGLINEATAQARRKELENESSFFGAMDGANKFVRGDAIAGILITFVNFIAGIIIGVIQRNLMFKDALETYTILTIGDGLVSQIPAIIISLAAGLLVSKTGTGSTDKALFGQLGQYPKALIISSALIGLMAFMPGIPAVYFLTVSIIMGGIGIYLLQTSDSPTQLTKIDKKTPASVPGHASNGETSSTPKSNIPAIIETEEEALAKAMHIDTIKLELGYNLLSLLQYNKGSKLTDQIKAMRKHLVRELGFVMPSVRIQDNMKLLPNDYVISIKDVECASGNIRHDKMMILNPGGQDLEIEGELTTDPTFGLPAKWINENLKDEAMAHNYTVIDPPTVITTHLCEVIKNNIVDLVTYVETQKLLDDLSDDHQKLIREFIPSNITVSGVQRILQNLLIEHISIRDFSSIIEAIAESARMTNNLTMITEHTRAKLARQISHMFAIDQNLSVIAMSPEWEQTFSESISQSDDKKLTMSPSRIQDFLNQVGKIYDEQIAKGHNPVILTGPQTRPYVASLVHQRRKDIAVISQNEVHPQFNLKIIAKI